MVRVSEASLASDRPSQAQYSQTTQSKENQATHEMKAKSWACEPSYQPTNQTTNQSTKQISNRGKQAKQAKKSIQARKLSRRSQV